MTGKIAGMLDVDYKYIMINKQVAVHDITL